MNPRHELVAEHLAQDRADLLTATTELQEHVRDCVTCTADTCCIIGQELLEAQNRLDCNVQMLQQKLPPDLPGICTDERAGNPPCSWVDPEHTLCSACPPPVNYSVTEDGHDALQ